MFSNISKKLSVLTLTAALDLLIAFGIVPSDARDKILILINSLSGLYITIQGLIDMFKARNG